MKLENRHWINSFQNLLNKLQRYSEKKTAQQNPLSSYKLEQENDSILDSSILIGVTKGYLDFYPDETWKWFVDTKLN
ncbi:MAG: hypothetical protein QNJ31_02345 [Candidatus Caenarcaniphilales bacterium]|nr:hypothetical protein [Candidatus Caenarcaniphilales bacterium]